jgi:hypothetical protein
MSDSLAPSWVVAKITDVGACRRNSAGKRKMPARLVATAVVLAALFNCNIALAQVDTPFSGTVAPTPMIGATSPLGVASGSGASPAGIPLGSTEITSPGVSPVPTGVTGTITIPTTSSSTACPTVAISPSEMFGSTASFDGGGLAMGTAAPATATNSGATAMSPASTMSATSSTSGVPVTSGSSGTLDTSGMSGMCGSGSSSLAASSAPSSTAPTAPGGVARTGIPFGSFEIANLGVGSTPPVPLPSVLPTASPVAPSPMAPTVPTLSPTTLSTTASSNPACANPGSAANGSFAGAGTAGITGTTLSARLQRQSILCQRP